MRKLTANYHSLITLIPDAQLRFFLPVLFLCVLEFPVPTTIFRLLGPAIQKTIPDGKFPPAWFGQNFPSVKKFPWSPPKNFVTFVRLRYKIIDDLLNSLTLHVYLHHNCPIRISRHDTLHHHLSNAIIWHCCEHSSNCDRPKCVTYAWIKVEANCWIKKRSEREDIVSSLHYIRLKPFLHRTSIDLLM